MKEQSHLKKEDKKHITTIHYQPRNNTNENVNVVVSNYAIGQPVARNIPQTTPRQVPFIPQAMSKQVRFAFSQAEATPPLAMFAVNHKRPALESFAVKCSKFTKLNSDAVDEYPQAKHIPRIFLLIGIAFGIAAAVQYSSRRKIDEELQYILIAGTTFILSAIFAEGLLRYRRRDKMQTASNYKEQELRCTDDRFIKDTQAFSEVVARKRPDLLKAWENLTNYEIREVFRQRDYAITYAFLDARDHFNKGQLEEILEIEKGPKRNAAYSAALNIFDDKELLKIKDEGIDRALYILSEFEAAQRLDEMHELQEQINLQEEERRKIELEQEQTPIEEAVDIVFKIEMSPQGIADEEVENLQSSRINSGPR